MLNKYALGLLASLLSYSANTRILCALGPGAAAYKASADQRPSSDAMLLVGRATAALKSIGGSNCPAVMVLRNATAANAMLMVENGQGKLVYSPRFFASVHQSFGDAGIVALVAHEFGHALDDVLGAKWIETRWTPELRADAWGGAHWRKAI